jgi:hypothetical protein
MTADGFTARWLFRLLDYEHYTISHDGHPTGMVILNHADRSIMVQGYDEGSDTGAIQGEHGYQWWRRWLREHEEPLS